MQLMQLDAVSSIHFHRTKGSTHLDIFNYRQLILAVTRVQTRLMYKMLNCFEIEGRRLAISRSTTMHCQKHSAETQFLPIGGHNSHGTTLANPTPGNDEQLRINHKAMPKSSKLCIPEPWYRLGCQMRLPRASILAWLQTLSFKIDGMKQVEMYAKI